MLEVTLPMEPFIKYLLNTFSIDKMWFKTAATLALTQFCPFPVEKAFLLFYIYPNSISYFQIDFFFKVHQQICNVCGGPNTLPRVKDSDQSKVL